MTKLSVWTQFANHRVMCFQGATETRKGTARQYKTISLRDIASLAEKPTREPKEKALAILQSNYNYSDGRTHEVQREKGQFTCLCGDIDRGNLASDDIQEFVEKLFGNKVALLIYSSSSATVENKKWRVIVPLRDPMPYGPWSELMEVLYAFLGEEGCTLDTALLKAGQPVYMPNVQPALWDGDKPQFYDSYIEDGEGAHAQMPVVLEWTAKLAIQRANENAKRAEAARLKSRATTYPKISGFNAKHDLDGMLSGVGYKSSPTRAGDWKSPLQTSDSYATHVFINEEGGKYWVSLSESDKLAGLGRATASGSRCGDAFDIYVYYKLSGDFSKALQSLESPSPVLDYSALALAASADTPDDGKPKDVSIADILDNPSPPVEFIIEGILPAGVVTLFAGHGGTCKSILSLQVAVSVAMGLPFLGMETQKVKVLVYSAEDSGHVVRYRLNNICSQWKISPTELARNLTVLDASEVDPVLFAEKRENSILAGVPTPAMQDLINAVARTGARLIILDNVSDVYGADEIKRPQVRTFIRMQAQLARRTNAALLLLAHVDKQTARGNSEEGYSGSTAWNNSVRSRLFIRTDKDALMIEHQKSNYGKRIEPISVVFDRGLIVLAENASNSYALSEGREAKSAAVLGMIDEFYQRGEWISTATTSPNNAFKVLSRESSYPKGLIRTDLWQLLRDAERSKKLNREAYKNSSRHESHRWLVVNSASTLRQLDSQRTPQEGAPSRAPL